MKLPTDITPRPDIEDILCDLLESKAAEIEPTPLVVTQLPTDYEQTITSTPIIHEHANHYGKKDHRRRDNRAPS